MSSFSAFAAGLPLLCRTLVLIGLSVFLQSSFLLIVGMLSARALRREGPSTQRFVYQATLIGVASCLLLTVFSAENRSALLPLALPEARMLATDDTRPTSVTLQTSSPLSRGETAPAGSKPNSLQAPVLRGIATGGMRIEVQPETLTAGNSLAALFPESDHPPFLPEAVSRQTSRAGRLYLGIAGVWAFGVGIQCVWLLVCSLRIRRICRYSRPISDDNATAYLTALCTAGSLRTPPLRISAEVESVYLAGLRNPMILLPTAYADDFDATTLRAVPAHEVAHLAQSDTWWVWASQLLCAVFWMQPLLRPVCRRREQACEELCDMVALSQDCPPRLYAQCLVALTERLQNARSPRLPVNGVVMFRSSLGERVQYILGGPRPMKPLSAFFRIAIHPNFNAVEQAQLLDSFLRVFPRDILEEIRSAGGDVNDFGYLVLPRDDGNAGQPGSPVRIDVMFTTHGDLTAGYSLGLPTALPNDRREKTRILLDP